MSLYVSLPPARVCHCGESSYLVGEGENETQNLSYCHGTCIDKNMKDLIVTIGFSKDLTIVFGETKFRMYPADQHLFHKDKGEVLGQGRFFECFLCKKFVIFAFPCNHVLGTCCMTKHMPTSRLCFKGCPNSWISTEVYKVLEISPPYELRYQHDIFYLNTFLTSCQDLKIAAVIEKINVEKDIGRKMFLIEGLKRILSGFYKQDFFSGISNEMFYDFMNHKGDFERPLENSSYIPDLVEPTVRIEQCPSPSSLAQITSPYVPSMQATPLEVPPYIPTPIDSTAAKTDVKGSMEEEDILIISETINKLQKDLPEDVLDFEADEEVLRSVDKGHLQKERSKSEEKMQREGSKLDEKARGHSPRESFKKPVSDAEHSSRGDGGYKHSSKSKKLSKRHSPYEGSRLDSHKENLDSKTKDRHEGKGTRHNESQNDVDKRNDHRSSKSKTSREKLIKLEHRLVAPSTSTSDKMKELINSNYDTSSLSARWDQPQLTPMPEYFVPPSPPKNVALNAPIRNLFVHLLTSIPLQDNESRDLISTSTHFTNLRDVTQAIKKSSSISSDLCGMLLEIFFKKETITDDAIAQLKTFADTLYMKIV